MPQVLYPWSLGATFHRAPWQRWEVNVLLSHLSITTEVWHCKPVQLPAVARQSKTTLSAATTEFVFSHHAKTSAPVNNPEETISRAGSDLEQTIISDHFSGVSEANILYDTVMLGDFLVAFNPSLPRICAKPQIQILRTHLRKTTSFWSRRQVLYRKFAEGNSFRKVSSKRILLSLFLKVKKRHTSSIYNHPHLQIPSMPSSLRW